MWKLLLKLSLVVVLLPAASIGQRDRRQQRLSIPMKSFQVEPSTPAQVQALKDFRNSDSNSGKYYFRSGRIALNTRIEILVPANSDGEKEFLDRIEESGLNSTSTNHFDRVKLKFYLSPDRNRNEGAQELTNSWEVPLGIAPKPRPILGVGLYPTTGNTYKIKNLNSRKCVTIERLPGSNTGPRNGKISLQTCVDQEAGQGWTLQTPTGYTNQCGGNANCRTFYWLVNGGVCLTVGTDMRGSENDTPVLQNQCQYVADQSQLWYVDRFTTNNPGQINVPENERGTYYPLVSGKTGRCLSHGGDGNGAKMYIYDCWSGYKNQFFAFIN